MSFFPYFDDFLRRRLAALSLLPFGSRHTPRYDWAFDAGHGRLQPGKRSPKRADGTRFEEWRFNRIIVRGLLGRLRARGVSCWEVVPEDDVGSFLPERVGRINARRSKLPRVGVSIHANAGPPTLEGDWSTARGTETYHFPGSRQGRALAEICQRHLVERLGRRDRGVRTADWMYVLRNTHIPMILPEIAFFNNPYEVTLLDDPAFQERTIDALEAFVMEVERHGL
jgi:N-acetylmuramoyl-L-alanine amidase